MDTVQIMDLCHHVKFSCNLRNNIDEHCYFLFKIVCAIFNFLEHFEYRRPAVLPYPNAGLVNLAYACTKSSFNHTFLLSQPTPLLPDSPPHCTCIDPACVVVPPSGLQKWLLLFMPRNAESFTNRKGGWSFRLNGRTRGQRHEDADTLYRILLKGVIGDTRRGLQWVFGFVTLKSHL